MGVVDKEKTKRSPERTRAQLLKTALEEFMSRGYEGTGTNRIAKQAGFAPQTFYRHFQSKLEIFIAVYRQWVERRLYLVVEQEDLEEVAHGLIEEHQKMRLFRRSLKHLAVVDETVRQERARQRSSQLRHFLGDEAPLEDAIYWLLSLERWLDAFVEGELRDLGVGDTEAKGKLYALLKNRPSG